MLGGDQVREAESSGMMLSADETRELRVLTPGTAGCAWSNQ